MSVFTFRAGRTMKTLYNVESYPQVVDHELPAVQPGESWEFDDDVTPSGNWSEIDPRAGLEAEKTWKKRRDEKPAVAEDAASPAAEEPPVAEAGDDKEN